LFVLLAQYPVATGDKSKIIFVKLSNHFRKKRRIMENNIKKLLKNLGFQKG
jgi:hypothetical protein